MSFGCVTRIKRINAGDLHEPEGPADDTEDTYKPQGEPAYRYEGGEQGPAPHPYYDFFFTCADPCLCYPEGHTCSGDVGDWIGGIDGQKSHTYGNLGSYRVAREKESPHGARVYAYAYGYKAHRLIDGYEDLILFEELADMFASSSKSLSRRYRERHEGREKNGERD